MTRNQIFAYVVGGIVALIAIGNIFSDDDDDGRGISINISGDGGSRFKAVNTPDGKVTCQSGQDSVTYTHSDGSTTEITC